MSRDELFEEYNLLLEKASSAKTTSDAQRLKHKAVRIRQKIKAMDLRYFNFWNRKYSSNFWD